MNIETRHTEDKLYIHKLKVAIIGGSTSKVGRFVYWFTSICYHSLDRSGKRVIKCPDDRKITKMLRNTKVSFVFVIGKET